MFESSWPQYRWGLGGEDFNHREHRDIPEKPASVSSVLVKIFILSLSPIRCMIFSIALVANGAIDDFARIAQRLRAYPYVIAIDGGLSSCHRMGIKPHLIVGDMDSVSQSLLDCYADVPLNRLDRNKDQTDLEVALQMANTEEVKQMAVFGGLNKRLDHTLGNVYLLRRYPGRMVLESETERVFAIRGSAEISSYPGQIISLIPLGRPTQQVSSEGLRWELQDACLDENYFSISNEATGNCVSITVGIGDLICIVQFDPDDATVGA